MKMKTAVVIGSTGLVGNLLLEKLAQDTAFGQIIAICRKRPLPCDVFKNPKIRVILFNFDKWPDLELQVKSFVGNAVCSFFCCLGTTIAQAGSEEAFKKVDHDYVVQFAALAKVCRAEQLLVVSALGADKNSTVFYNRTKGEMEADVQNEFSGKTHFLRPSLLLGDRKDFRFVERIAILFAPLYSSLLFGQFKKYQPIPAITVARAMARIGAKKITAGLIIENHELFSIGVK